MSHLQEASILMSTLSQIMHATLLVTGYAWGRYWCASFNLRDNYTNILCLMFFRGTAEVSSPA